MQALLNIALLNTSVSAPDRRKIPDSSGSETLLNTMQNRMSMGGPSKIH